VRGRHPRQYAKRTGGAAGGSGLAHRFEREVAAIMAQATGIFAVPVTLHFRSKKGRKKKKKKKKKRKRSCVLKDFAKHW
jgi:hypothetical protein